MNLSQHKKAQIWQTKNKHHSQWWKTGSISYKIKNNTRVLTFASITQHNCVSPNHRNRKRKRSKTNPNWRSNTVTLCKWHVATHKKSIDDTKKLLDPINEFSKVSGYKNQYTEIFCSPIHNSYSYSNKWSEGKVKETIPFTTETINKIPS